MSAPGETETRLRLFRAGFSPLPIMGKAPQLKGWQEKLDSNVEEITLWGKLFAYAANTGILTARTPAFDIDIRDERWQERMDDVGRAVKSARQKIGQGDDAQRTEAKNTKTFIFNPEPDQFPDPISILPRQWLYGRHYIRGAVSMTIGAPGRAKSTNAMTEIIGMTVGRNLLTGEELPCGPLRAAYLNGEENQDELDRRAAAICQRYEITAADCGNRLWMVATRDNPIKVAVRGPKGDAEVATAVVNGLTSWCNDRKIDVLTIDPLISFHRILTYASGLTPCSRPIPTP